MFVEDVLTVFDIAMPRDQDVVVTRIVDAWIPVRIVGDLDA
jgi:hypothetical protein